MIRRMRIAATAIFHLKPHHIPRLSIVYFLLARLIRIHAYSCPFLVPDGRGLMPRGTSFNCFSLRNRIQMSFLAPQ